MRGKVDPAGSANHLSCEDLVFPFQREDAGVLYRLEWIDPLSHVGFLPLVINEVEKAIVTQI
jgi:hypothetical protein